MVELHADLVAFDRHRLIERTGINLILAVDLRQCPEGQPLGRRPACSSDGCLSASPMSIVTAMPVLGARLERHRLGFPQFGPACRIGSVRRSGTGRSARNRRGNRLGPSRPASWRIIAGKQRAILIRLGDVRFALIPDCAADGVGHAAGRSCRCTRQDDSPGPTA